MDTVNGLSAAQNWALLEPIDSARIKYRGKGSKEYGYLPQWDVRRRLIQIFGFGGFDIETLVLKQASVIQHESRVFVVYQVRLTIKRPDGSVIARYEDAATGDAIGHVGATDDDTRLGIGEAFDLAVKSAISNALKRCTINLGDQFGLSLYNDGSTDAAVGATLLDPPAGVPDSADDVINEALIAQHVADDASPLDECDDADSESMGADRNHTPFDIPAS